MNKEGKHDIAQRGGFVVQEKVQYSRVGVNQSQEDRTPPMHLFYIDPQNEFIGNPITPFHPLYTTGNSTNFPERLDMQAYQGSKLRKIITLIIRCDAMAFSGTEHKFEQPNSWRLHNDKTRWKETRKAVFLQWLQANSWVQSLCGFGQASKVLLETFTFILYVLYMYGRI